MKNLTLKNLPSLKTPSGSYGRSRILVESSDFDGGDRWQYEWIAMASTADGRCPTQYLIPIYPLRGTRGRVDGASMEAWNRAQEIFVDLPCNDGLVLDYEHPESLDGYEREALEQAERGECAPLIWNEAQDRVLHRDWIGSIRTLSVNEVEMLPDSIEWISETMNFCSACLVTHHNADVTWSDDSAGAAEQLERVEAGLERIRNEFGGLVAIGVGGDHDPCLGQCECCRTRGISVEPIVVTWRHRAE